MEKTNVSDTKTSCIARQAIPSAIVWTLKSAQQAAHTIECAFLGCGRASVSKQSCTMPVVVRIVTTLPFGMVTNILIYFSFVAPAERLTLESSALRLAVKVQNRTAIRPTRLSEAVKRRSHTNRREAPEARLKRHSR